MHGHRAFVATLVGLSIAHDLTGCAESKDRSSQSNGFTQVRGLPASDYLDRNLEKRVDLPAATEALSNFNGFLGQLILAAGGILAFGGCVGVYIYGGRRVYVRWSTEDQRRAIGGCIAGVYNGLAARLGSGQRVDGATVSDRIDAEANAAGRAGEYILENIPVPSKRSVGQEQQLLLTDDNDGGPPAYTRQQSPDVHSLD